MNYRRLCSWALLVVLSCGTQTAHAFSCLGGDLAISYEQGGLPATSPFLINEGVGTAYDVVKIIATDSTYGVDSLVLDTSANSPDAGDVVAGTSQVIPGGLELTLRFAQDPDFENPTDSDTDSVYELRFTASNCEQAVSSDVSIQVEDVESSPVIAYNSSSDLTVYGKTLAAIQSALEAIATHYQATDEDQKDLDMDWNFSGPTGSSFVSGTYSDGSISVAMSAMTSQFGSLVTQDGQYNLEIDVSDEDGNSDEQTIIWMFGNRAPEVTTNSGNAISVTFKTIAEVISHFGGVATNLSATDADNDAVTLTVSAVNPNNVNSSVNTSNTGAVSMPWTTVFTALDESVLGTYVFTAVASDGDKSATTTYTVNLQNSVPVIAYNVGANNTITAKTKSIAITALQTSNTSYTVTDSDSSDEISLTATVTDQSGLVTTVNASSTSPLDLPWSTLFADVDESTEGTATAAISVTDGVAVINQTITLEIGNSLPVIAFNGGSDLVIKNKTAAGSIADLEAIANTVSVTDADGESINLNVAVSATNGVNAQTDYAGPTGTVSQTTATVFNAINATGTYAYALTATDAQATTTMNLSVEVTGETQPVFTNATSPLNLSLQEGVSEVYTFAGSDTDDDAFTFYIATSTDQDDFQINTTTGELAFASTTIHDSPADANTDNVYEISVGISDGNHIQNNEITVVVTVTDAVVVSSSSGGGGGTRYTCRDTEALNYSRTGTHDTNMCEYEEEVASSTETVEDVQEEVIQEVAENIETTLELVEQITVTSNVNNQTSNNTQVQSDLNSSFQAKTTISPNSESRETEQDNEIVAESENNPEKEIVAAQEDDNLQQANVLSAGGDRDLAWYEWVAVLLALGGGAFVLKQYLVFRSLG